MANAAEEMMELGQWVTLEGWLKQLPEDVLQEWPTLVYTKGEIAAAHGHIAEARRMFAVSSNLFSSRGEPEGACQSLLAESTLAAWEGDTSRARNFPQSASVLAQKAGLTDKMGEINWQLAKLAAAADTLEEALAYLLHVGDTPTDPGLGVGGHPLIFSIDDGGGAGTLAPQEPISSSWVEGAPGSRTSAAAWSGPSSSRSTAWSWPSSAWSPR